MFVYGGMRSVKAVWPALLVAGGSFAISQFVTSNFIDYSLTDVLASTGSLIATLAFLMVWRPAPDPQYAIAKIPVVEGTRGDVPAWQGWLPWFIVTVVVIVWTSFQISRSARSTYPGRASTRRSRSRSTTTSPMPPCGRSSRSRPAPRYFVAALITALVCGHGLGKFVEAAVATVKRIWLAVITVCLIVGLAYLMNYSGLAYTLGKGVASVGALFVILSPFLAGSRCSCRARHSGNALFGNLQVVAARQLNLNPVLFARPIRRAA